MFLEKEVLQWRELSGAGDSPRIFNHLVILS